MERPTFFTNLRVADQENKHSGDTLPLYCMPRHCVLSFQRVNSQDRSGEPVADGDRDRA